MTGGCRAHRKVSPSAFNDEPQARGPVHAWSATYNRSVARRQVPCYTDHVPHAQSSSSEPR